MTEPDYRFTLANERTLLAYERTAIALVAAAGAVAHFLDGWQAVVLAALLLVAGAAASIGGYLRFRAVDRAIRHHAPLPANPAVHILGAAVIACLVAAAVTVFR